MISRRVSWIFLTCVVRELQILLDVRGHQEPRRAATEAAATLGQGRRGQSARAPSVRTNLPKKRIIFRLLANKYERHARPSPARPAMERTRDRGQTLKRGRGFQAARSRRIPVIEGLGDRRVPAALLHDVALVTASTADSRGMRVDTNAEEL